MYQKKGDLYLQAGEQLVAPGATQDVLRICGKYIARDSGMGIRDIKLGGNYFPSETEYDGRLDLILLSHHHLDHSGNLPALIRNNPKARVIMTRPAAMGAEIMLRDSLKIHETEQKKILRQGGSLTPFIYSASDIDSMLRRTTPIAGPGWYEVWPGWFFGFYSAGHTRGAMMTFIVPPEGPAYFITGDVCSHDQPVVKGVMLPPREFFGNRLDGKRIIMITETTYGNREMPESFDELWKQFGDCIVNTVKEGLQDLLPSFSDRAPNIALEMIKRGIYPHVDGMARDFILLHSKSDYSWCSQDIRFDVQKFLAEKKLVLYEKLDRNSPQEKHQAEERHRRDTASGSCCGMKNSPIISSSAMMDKGMSVRHGERLLPDRKARVIFTGYMFPGSVGESILKVKKGDTVKLKSWDPEKKCEMERPVPVSCEVIRFGLSAHDTADKLTDRVRLMNEICPLEALILHHGDQESVDGFTQRVRALNLDIPVFHGKHMKEIQL